jgi:hypothetical protein
LIQHLTDRRRWERGELTDERDSGEGAQVVNGEGGGGLYEMRLSFSRWRA